MNTKKLSLGLMLAAAAVTSPAFAIPLSFDFTGTVQTRQLYQSSVGTWITDTSWIGQSFTAQMVIDTDRFVSPPIVSEDASSRTQFMITNEAAPPAWSGSLTIGGTTIDVQPYARNYSYVQATDSKGPQSCGGGCAFGVNDSVLLVTRSDFQGALGTERSSLFQLLAYQSMDLSNSDASIYTYVNLDQLFSPDSLLTLDLPNLSFSYQTSTFDCQAIGCFFDTGDITRFNVESVTRTDLSAASVPEPGTLGLLSAGLLLARFSRRRRQAA